VPGSLGAKLLVGRINHLDVCPHFVDGMAELELRGHLKIKLGIYQKILNL